jgi:hypothetical protein
LTLFTTPVVYLYLDRFSNRMPQRHSHADRDATDAQPHPAGAGVPQENEPSGEPVASG